MVTWMAWLDFQGDVPLQTGGAIHFHVLGTESPETWRLSLQG